MISREGLARRKAINLLGASLAAVPVLVSGNAAAQGQAQAQSQAQQGPTGTRRPGIKDPHNKYPKPPFAAQQQPRPGLAGNMNPRHDQGEPAMSDRAG